GHVGLRARRSAGARAGAPGLPRRRACLLVADLRAAAGSAATIVPGADALLARPVAGAGDHRRLHDVLGNCYLPALPGDAETVWNDATWRSADRRAHDENA